MHQAEPITDALIRERLAARDRFLDPLNPIRSIRERDALLAANRDVGATFIELVDRLARAGRSCE